MDARTLLDRLHQQAPFAGMVRGAIDWFFEPEFLDALAEEAYRTNYTRDIHFADLVELLLPVVFQPGRTVRSSSRGNPRLAAVATLASFYGKLNGVDPGVSRALVGRTAGRAAAVSTGEATPAGPPVPGYRLLTLDDNHLAATERRLDGLSACTACRGRGWCCVSSPPACSWICCRSPTPTPARRATPRPFRAARRGRPTAW